MRTLDETPASDAESPAQVESLKPDAYSIKYAIWIGILCLLGWISTLDRNLNHFVLTVFIFFLAAFVLAARLVIGLGINLFARRWRRASSIVAAPIIIYSLVPLLGWLGLPPDRDLILLRLWKSSYMADVEAIPVKGGHLRLKTWDFGEVGGVATSNVFWTLVYDESDLLALPPAAWSAEAIQNANEDSGTTFHSFIHGASEDGNHNIQVKHLEGHFYVVVEIV